MKRARLVICAAGLLLLQAFALPVWAAPGRTRGEALTSKGGRVGALRGNPNYSATISGTPIRVGSITRYALEYPGSWTDIVTGTYAAMVDAASGPTGSDYEFDVDFAAKDTSSSQTCSKDFDCTYCVLMCPDVMPCPGPECYQADGLPTSVADSDECTGVDAGDQVLAPGTALTNTTASLREPAFPVPLGTGILFAQWDYYHDIPYGSGYVQYSEYRYFKNGAWSSWRITNPNGAKISGSRRAWQTEIHEIPEAAQADSVQLRHWVQCDPVLGPDGVNCTSPASLYYDNLSLFAFTGVPPTPIFGLFPGSAPQTTFVDGTMTGLNCTSTPCWPGIRGSDLAGVTGIDDNVNSAEGDSVVIRLHSALRTNGMGINWRHGFDKSSNGGTTIAHTNASHVPGSQVPRMIYRLFDPATRTWSAFDSTALDADDVHISGADTIVVGDAYRMDWPPRDKAGLNLPGGFTINGQGAYNNLAFLPRGARLQYYFKAVDVAGTVAYQFQGEDAAYEVDDLPTLPGGTAKAPDILEFDVLPRVYAPGSAGTLLAGRTSTPILNLDGAYTAWSFSQDPVIQALRGLGVRADRYRLQQAPGYGNNIGGHELTGPPDNQKSDRPTNHFPNMNEYSIGDSLSTWYRILIQSSHLRNAALEDEADARLIEAWWNSPTGSNGGDRCLFTSGEDYANALLNAGASDPSSRRTSYASNVLGIQSAAGAWAGSGSNLHPTVEDRFANPASGPGLVAGYTYPTDCGCPGPNRPDALTKVASPDAQNVAFYPLFSGVTDVAGVARMSEADPITDKDRSKALAYGFSVQYVRKTGIPTNASNYVHSGVEERMQVLYKFLTSCRGARTGASADSGKCWPCPTSVNLTGNWANVFGFQTSTYGPLYPIQDHNLATGVEPGPGVPRVGDQLRQNRPNPFNPATTIPFTTAAAGPVVVRIFDAGGRLVRSIDLGRLPAGEHVTRWDGRLQDGETAASGVYFYRIEFPGGGVSSRKMILLR